MNLQNDFIKLDSRIQEVFENWDNKILPHLPQQLDEMAKRTDALHRKRGVCSCVDLPRMLFLYASSNFSFRIPATAACAPGISAISDTAWRKRFPKLRLSCVKYSIPCFPLFFRQRIFLLLTVWKMCSWQTLLSSARMGNNSINSVFTYVIRWMKTGWNRWRFRISIQRNPRLIFQWKPANKSQDFLAGF